MIRLRLFRAVLTISLLCGLAGGQSTSPWKRVANATFGDETNPAPGADYMSVYVRTASVYQNSNWWTNFIEKNRQAIITVNVEGDFAGRHIAQTKVGRPVELRRNNALADLGYSGVVVEALPLTFSNMSLTISINKSAKDGLADLLSAVSQLSQAQPPVLSISQQTMGIASLSKTLADYLFHANLIVQKLSTQSPLPIVGVLDPGIYVCFAGDSTADYQQYLLPGNPGLRWDGTVLTFNNAPINKISYFVVEVGYSKRFFHSPHDSLSFGGTRPWAALFQVAEAEIPRINNADDAKRIHDDVQSHLDDANTLLNADPDFTADEKKGIYTAIYQETDSAYKDRLVALRLATPQPAEPAAGGGAAPGAGGLAQIPLAPTTPGTPTVLSLPNTQDQAWHINELNQINLNNRPMMPTGAGAGPH